MSQIFAARDLCKMLAALNYRRDVTVESFKRPNFELVADILLWLAEIVEEALPNSVVELAPFLKPQIDKLQASNNNNNKLNDNFANSKSMRIAFLQAIGKLFKTELKVSLDLQKLYRADLSSCNELQKVLVIVYKSSLLALNQVDSKSALLSSFDSALITVDTALELFSIGDKQEEQSFEFIADKLASYVKNLCSLLDKESESSDERTKAIDRRLDLAPISSLLLEARDELTAMSSDLQVAETNLQSDLQRLNSRCQDKEAEVIQAQERLEDLLLEAPAYVAKYDELHKQYEDAYEQYVTRFRCLSYLSEQVYLNCINCDDKLSVKYKADSLQRETKLKHYNNNNSYEEDDDLETTGPARLAESLAAASDEADALGASKPKSGSDSGDVGDAVIGATGAVGAVNTDEDVRRGVGMRLRYEDGARKRVPPSGEGVETGAELNRELAGLLAEIGEGSGAELSSDEEDEEGDDDDEESVKTDEDGLKTGVSIETIPVGDSKSVLK